MAQLLHQHPRTPRADRWLSASRWCHDHGVCGIMRRDQIRSMDGRYIYARLQYVYGTSSSTGSSSQLPRRMRAESRSGPRSQEATWHPIPLLRTSIKCHTTDTYKVPDINFSYFFFLCIYLSYTGCLYYSSCTDG